MKITYDKKANAAYIYIKDSINTGEVTKTYPCDPSETGMINLDFNIANQLIGIEILDANKKLPKEIIDKADLISE